MASLDQTLQVFRALLGSEDCVGEADRAIWAFLTPIDGLDAQAEALGRLRRAVEGLDAASAFMPALLDDLDRHRERLAEPLA